MNSRIYKVEGPDAVPSRNNLPSFPLQGPSILELVAVGSPGAKSSRLEAPPHTSSSGKIRIFFPCALTVLCSIQRKENLF
jgi:hypothetical protein